MTDTSQNIYIGGRHADSCNSSDFSKCNFDNLLLKVNSTGAFGWAKTWGSSGYDSLMSLGTDSNSNILALGMLDTYGAAPQLLVGTFDGAGNPLHSLVHSGGTDAATQPLGIVIDPSNNVIVSGSALNNSGTWGQTTLTVATPIGCASNNCIVASSIAPFQVSISAGPLLTQPLEAIPAGIADTGGGGADAFVSAIPSGSLLPPPPPTTHTLTVNSTNPSSDVQVSVSPADNSGASGGKTRLTLTYDEGVPVTVSAPPMATAGGNSFSSWTGCDSPPSNPDCMVTMSSDHIVTANYTKPGPTTPALAINPTSLNFGVEVVGRTSETQALRLTNSGASQVSISNIATNSDFPVRGGTCPSTPFQLDRGASCTIDLALSPSAGGNRVGSLTVSTNDPVNPTQQIQVAGTGMVGFFQFSSSPQYFDSNHNLNSSYSCPMKDEGCALASLSSLFTEFDPTTSPMSVDNYLTNNQGYVDLVKPNPDREDQCSLNWDVAKNYLTSTNNPTILQPVDSLDATQQAPITLDDALAYLAAHASDLVAIKLRESSSCSNFPHVVAAVRPKGQNDWEVFDPGWSTSAGAAMTLAGHLIDGFATNSSCGVVQRSFAMAGFRTYRSSTDPRGLGVKVFSPVEVMVTDSQGRRLGSSDGIADFFEIPSGSYMRDSRTLIDDPMPPANAEQVEGKTAYVPWPAEGSYAVSVRGTDFGPFMLEIFTVASDGSRQSAVLNGFAALGSASNYTFEYSSAPGSSLAVSQQSVGSQLSLSAPSVAFGSQAVGTTSAGQSVSFADTGTSPVTISSASISGPNSADFVIASGTTCPIASGSVAIASSCTINVTFKPSAAGTRTATLTITDNAPGSPHVVTLTGTGFTPVVTFGGSVQMPLTKDVSGNWAAVVTVTNKGNITVDSAQIAMTTTKLGTVQATAVSGPISRLAPGASATITIVFPASAVPAGATSEPLRISGSYTAGILSGNWGLTFRSVSVSGGVPLS